MIGQPWQWFGKTGKITDEEIAEFLVDDDKLLRFIRDAREWASERDRLLAEKEKP